ncbi:MAG: hypothetical protein J0L86_07905 [Flavobacteriales bacterium]|nr:hypothetical protein [Flavobacteriales bacterium]
MKKLLFFGFFLTSVLCFGQVPQGISYQAIALDGSGNPIVSLPVGIQLSILDSSASGSVLYTETHTPTTNAQGLYNLVIGQGTPTTGTFSTIKWENNSKFLQVEMDAAGGTNYALVGSTQLLSVPYALYAGKVNVEDVVGGPDMFGYTGDWYSSSFMTNTNAYVFAPAEIVFDSSVPPSPNTWHSTPISGIPFKKSENSFLTSTNAYIFGPTSAGQSGDHTNSWHIFPISGQPVTILTNIFYSTLIITTTNAYAYTYDSTGLLAWHPTTISGTVVDVSARGLGILTSTNAYIFNNNSWQSIPISGTPLKIKHVREGILMLTSTNAYLYGTNTTHPNGGSTSSWHNIPFSGNLLLD